MNKERIGKYIKFLRERNNLTQEELAKKGHTAKHSAHDRGNHGGSRLPRRKRAADP